MGIVINRKSEEFSNAIEVLEKNYLQYVERVNHFSRAHLNWDSVAKQHVELYLDVISNADYGRNYSNNYMPTQKQNDIENSLSSSWKKYSLLLPLNYLTNKFINLP